MGKAKFLTKTIWIVSLVSLFTDVASEMLYPVMPLYLKSIGFSVLLIGILEGLAEATAGLSKGYFGNLSDRIGKRVPFIRAGYGMSAISKPMLAIFSFPIWIFFARTIDRLGKGVRNSARDALLSDESSRENKGKVFGFHRGMDTLGAAIGPMLALLFLYLLPGGYKWLFIIAFIPGIIAVSLTFTLKEKENKPSAPKPGISFFTYLKYWKTSSKSYKKLVAGLLAFTIFNSSDVLLLLMLKQNGISDTGMIGFYIFYNLVYAVFSYPMGMLADKIGMKRVLIAGFIIFAFVYLGMGFMHGWVWYGILFFAYGIYASATEGISKALISNISNKEDTATAIGFYASFASLFALLASTIGGLLWSVFNPQTTFLFSGIGVGLVVVYFLFNLKFKIED